jgi:ABC-type sugar transport system, periplasmic component
MKKVLSILIGMVFLLTAFSGCAPQGNATTENPSAQTAEASRTTAEAAEPITITAFLNAIPQFGTNNDAILKEIHDKFLADKGIDLTIDIISSEVSQTKESVLMKLAANSVDVVTVPSGMNQFFDNGDICTELDNLDNYPNIIKTIPAETMLQGKYDGKQYMVAIDNPSLNLVVPWIRKDLLDKSGLPVPETMEDLYTAIKSIQATDKKFLGFAAGNTGWVFCQSFGLGCPESYEDADGNFKASMYSNFGYFYAFHDKRQTEFLKMMAKWFQEGVIWQEIWQTRTELIPDLINSGRLIAMAYDSADFQDKADRLAGLDPDNPLPAGQETQKWVIMDKLSWQGKPCIWSYGPGASNFIFISKNSKYKAEILSFIDWMNSSLENVTLCTLGREGKEYTLADGKYESLLPTNQTIKLFTGFDSCITRSDLAKELFKFKSNHIGTEYQKVLADDFKTWYIPAWFVSWDFSDCQTKASDCETLMNEWMSNWFAGNIPNTDEEIDKLVAELKKAGWDQVYEACNKSYKAGKDALNKLK